MTKLIVLFVLFLTQGTTTGPRASISGRMVADHGQPLRDVAIQLFRMEYRSGVPRLIYVARASARTNEAGDFRVEVPAPGKYYLSAIAPGQQSIGRYYPGTVDSSDATPIEVSREDVRIADMVFSPVSTFTIRGRFIQPVGIRPRSAVYGVHRLDKRQTNDFPAVRLGFNGDPELFEVRVPAAGTYSLGFSLITDDANYLGRAVVEVRAANIEGVTIVPIRGGSIAVRATLDSIPVPFSQIHIDPDDTIVRPAIARPNSDGVLTFQGVYATRYNVGVDGLAPDLYISRIRFNGIDSAIPAFTPRENDLDGTLDIYFAKGSQIGVKVTSEAGSSPKGAVVALIPMDRKRHDLYQSDVAGEDGEVQFQGVAPGKYRIFAWDNIPNGAFLNSDFMKPFEDRGRDIVVENVSRLEVSLNIIGTLTRPRGNQRR